jgi:hypothetical protein
MSSGSVKGWGTFFKSKKQHFFFACQEIYASGFYRPHCGSFDPIDMKYFTTNEHLFKCKKCQKEADRHKKMDMYRKKGVIK